MQILGVRSSSYSSSLSLLFASQFIVGIFVSPLTHVYARIVSASVGVKFVLSN